MNPILIAFLLTAFAGLSTGFGSAIPFFFKTFKKSYLAFFLGVSAGVMILISFMNLLKNAMEVKESYWIYLAFFIGMAIVALLDFLIPHGKNPHHMPKDHESITTIQTTCKDNALDTNELIDSRIEKKEIETSQNKSLTRTGILTAIALALHNFPEGFATFASALDDITVGISITIAIAIHNIPEGISVSIPIYFATKKKWRSFGLSFASGIAEPIGALLAYAVLATFLNNPVIKETILAVSLAAVAGIMIYISIDELIPIAHEYGKGDLVMGGVATGMIIMAASLVLFQYLD